MIIWTKTIGLLGFGIHLLTSLSSSAQGVSERMRSAAHVFWQPENKLEANDYRRQVDPSEKEKLYCDSLELCTEASLGLWYKLDVPKRKRDRGKILEKVYIVPVFEFVTSYRIRDTPTGLQEQQVVFDIYELTARKARNELEHLHDSMPGYGIDYIFLETVMADAIALRKEMVDAYVRDVYIRSQEGSFEKWRKLIDDLLEESIELVTSTEDCQRFMSDRPLIDGYIESPTLMRAMKR